MEYGEESRLTPYGLAAVGLLRGLAVEGWRAAKEITNRRVASHAGQTALQLVEAPPMTEGNVVYVDFARENPKIAA